MEALYGVFLLALWFGAIIGAIVGVAALAIFLNKTPRDPVGLVEQMIITGQVPGKPAEPHAHGASVEVNLLIWFGLVVLTIVEVGLAYVELPLLLMLGVLVGLSVLKAAMIIAFFMHMRFERLSFVLTIVPATVITILLLGIIYPEAFRVLDSQKEATALVAPAEVEAAATVGAAE